MVDLTIGNINTNKTVNYAMYPYILLKVIESRTIEKPEKSFPSASVPGSATEAKM